ncbi:MAG: high-affinity nickel-transport family protein [candidate division NC10 bacterium]
MDPIISVVLLGLLLGIQHSTDADHVVAVATIASRKPRVLSGLVIGALWGVGHTATIALVGGAIILGKLTVTPGVERWLELAVAVMLIVLGGGRLVWTLKGRERVPPDHLLVDHAHDDHEVFHNHPHAHGALSHRHPHLHPSRRLLAILREVGTAQALRSIAVGLVHGLAGSAAVALLILSTIKDPYWATAYLLVFGAGTILGMMGVTAILTVPFALSARRFAGLHRSLAAGTGAVSLCLGIFLVYQYGFAG